MTSLKVFIASATIALASSTAIYAARPLPVVSKDGKRYYEYVVRRGETIYSVTRQFGIDKDAFLAANPAVASDGLKADATVLLPVESVPEKKVVPMPTTTITKAGETHLVQKGETLYGISKKYNTTVDKLIEANTWAEDGIKKGQVLALPISEPTNEYISDEVQTVASAEDDFTYENDDDNSPAPDLTRSYSIAVLLPLMLNSNEGDNPRADKTAATYTSFLKGMLMAADTLGRTGDKVTIHAIDTEGSDARVMSLINDPRVREADVVIAPDASSQISILASAPDTEYTLFNILNVPDTTYLHNHRVMQANIGHHDMYEKAIKAFNDKFAGYTPVILIPEGGKREKIEFVNTLKATYASMPFALAIKEIHFSGNLTEDDLASLTPDTEKYIFVPVSGALSEFNRINNAILQLKDKAADQNAIKLFGYPDWIAFRIDRLEKLHKLDTTIYSRFFDNPDSDEAKEFAAAYKAHFGTEVVDMVPKQEILGFDTACYLIESLRKNQGDIEEQPLQYTGIQSAFSFREGDGETGSTNEALYIINYSPSGKVLKEVY